MKNATGTNRLLMIEMRHRYTVLLVFIAILLSVLPFIGGDELAIFAMKLALTIILMFDSGRDVRVLADWAVVGVCVHGDVRDQFAHVPVCAELRANLRGASAAAADELRVLQLRDPADDRVRGYHAGVGAARALSVLEAIAGQFFIAVLIARLVSLEIVHSARDDRE